MANKKRILAVLALLIIIVSGVFGATDTFNETINSIGTGIYGVGRGMFPFTLSWSKYRDFNLLDEEEYDKARLQFSFAPSITQVVDYGYGFSSGKPYWLGENNYPSYYYYYYPSASITASLSQKLEKWTFKTTLSSKYAHPTENLTLSNGDSDRNYYSWYFLNSDGSLKYGDKDAISAFPWFYGERNILTNNIAFTASRTYEVEGLNSMSVSMGFEMGPWWMLNNVSNGNRLSDYYKVSMSAGESIMLKDTKQSTNLRWIYISASHSTSLSYTFGSVVPREKLNNYRLKGVLSDSLSLSVSGPQLYDSSTSISGSITLSNYLYFGQVAYMKDSGFYLSYDSTISLSGYLNLFGILNFSIYGSRYIVRGLDDSTLWSTSAEVYMSFNF